MTRECFSISTIICLVMLQIPECNGQATATFKIDSTTYILYYCQAKTIFILYRSLFITTFILYSCVFVSGIESK